MWKIVFSYLPILLLVYLMTRKNSMPSEKALPLVAAVLYFVVLIVFGQDPNLVHANVLSGLLSAWTPILIIGGAVFLFRTMEASGSLAVIRTWLNGISQNKVAQLMIVGWAFPFVIEGASGFGTPAAIAAPILVGLGFPPLRVAILALIMNSVPVSFGAVGTPTWFGFSGLTLTPQETLLIGFKSALMNGAAALFVPPMALMFVVKPRAVYKNAVFIFLSIAATVIPYILVARFNYEFPSLVGGTIGLIVTSILAKLNIGLSTEVAALCDSDGSSALPLAAPVAPSSEIISARTLVRAMFPIWGTLLLLIITRIPDLGIKSMLLAEEPNLSLALGSLGSFAVSPSLVVSFKEIFGTSIAWEHALLYVPSLLPFGLVSLLALAFSGSLSKTREVFFGTVHQMKKPTQALLGALVFVNLMMMGKDHSMVAEIGRNLSYLIGDHWQYAAAYLGAVGSFFSGSNTISNLTFGGIQDSIAQNLKLDRTTILALQSVGGAMGNMVCINNIVAVASVLALGNIEGVALKRTVRAMLVYGVVVGLVSMFL